MRVARERINEWVEESGMIGDIQDGFRNGRRTEDNLFMLERMIEMAKVRKECFLWLSLIWKNHMIEWIEGNCVR